MFQYNGHHSEFSGTVFAFSWVNGYLLRLPANPPGTAHRPGKILRVDLLAF